MGTQNGTKLSANLFVGYAWNTATAGFNQARSTSMPITPETFWPLHRWLSWSNILHQRRPWNDGYLAFVNCRISIRPSNSHGKSLKCSVTFLDINISVTMTIRNWQTSAPLHYPQIRQQVTYCTRLSHPWSRQRLNSILPHFSDSVGSCSEAISDLP